MPLLSVLVPVYNVARYLPDCLDSLVNQTLEDIEIICINDGSDDDSLEILYRYAEKDTRINVINKKNSGYGHTMNVGMKEARGEYIGILESDDFTDNAMFEQLYSAAIVCNADIIKTNYWEYRNGNKTLVRPLKDGPYNVVFNPRRDNKDVFYSQPAIWTAIYRREFLENNNIIFNETPGASYQDTSFNFIALACAERVILKDDAYVCYRRDNESSSVNSAGKVYCVLDEYKNCSAFLNSRPELAAELESLLPVLAWNTSQWNYERIAPAFKYEFLERLVLIFEDLWSKGQIYPKYWLDRTCLNDVMRILMDKDYFLHEVYCGFQKCAFGLSVLKQRVQQCDKVYLYGAGKIGSEIAGYLKGNGMDFEGFMVAAKEGNPESVLGKSVFSVDEVAADSLDGALVLLTVKEATQRQVLPVLREKGFREIIAIRQDMREYMTRFEKYNIHQLVEYVFDRQAHS